MACIEHLTTEEHSHYAAAELGWAWPVTLAEIQLGLLVKQVLAALGHQIEIPSPVTAAATMVDATREELDEARAQLRAHSAYKGPWPD